MWGLRAEERIKVERKGERNRLDQLAAARGGEGPRSMRGGDGPGARREGLERAAKAFAVRDNANREAHVRLVPQRRVAHARRNGLDKLLAARALRRRLVDEAHARRVLRPRMSRADRKGDREQGAQRDSP
jgi:hypothetical protein